MEKEIGRFLLDLRLFQNNNNEIIPEFNSNNFNMPKEVLITQLKTFVNMLEDNYKQDFKGNVVDISGKPDE